MATTRKSKKKTRKIAKILKLPTMKNNSKPNKRFSTNFEYGNLLVDIKSSVSGGKVKLNFKIESKNFSFSGVATLNERSFSELQDFLEMVVSNVRTNVRKIR